MADFNVWQAWAEIPRWRRWWIGKKQDVSMRKRQFLVCSWKGHVFHDEGDGQPFCYRCFKNL